MIEIMILLKERSNGSEAENTNNEPSYDPVTCSDFTTSLRHITMGITPMLTALVRWVDRILPWWKAHFFSPSVNYTKLDGNANEPCTAVHNGLQGQLRMIVA